VISVEEALARVFALSTPMGHENIPLAEAFGRVMGSPARAERDQPPFAASAMDGYAVVGPVSQGDRFTVIGEAAAGRAFSGQVNTGQSVRIFTGAPIPSGANVVIIQEDIAVTSSGIKIINPIGANANIRPEGQDFRCGDALSAPRRLRPVDLALLAAMNISHVAVSKRPIVAIIATGDELVMPGETPRADQIIASNSFAIKAMVEAEGAIGRLLPIARDNETSLKTVFSLAQGADMIVTIGGASVGDHDLVAPVADALGATRAFYKIALRPGKPLMAGRMGKSLLLGLPGNPVSSIVCAHLFMLPALRAMLGLGGWPTSTQMAAQLLAGDDGTMIQPFSRQDSALISVLSEADALLVRPPNDVARKAGELVRFIPI
jgi:molybdopterin molybdotransferase